MSDTVGNARRASNGQMGMVLTLIGAVATILIVMVGGIANNLSDLKSDMSVAIAEERRQREKGDTDVDRVLQVEIGELKHLVETRFEDEDAASTFRHESQDKHLDLIYERVRTLENGRTE